VGRSPDPPPEPAQASPDIPADAVGADQAAHTGIHRENQAAGHGAPRFCPRCGCELLDVASLAEQASALRAAVSDAVALQNPSCVKGGGDGIQAALLKTLMKAEDLAVAVARSLACSAGICGGAEEA